jgi:type IV secretion system protein VirB10
MEDSSGREGPSVAAPKGKNFVMVGLGILIILLLMYLFLGGVSTSRDDDEEEEQVITTAVRSQPAVIAEPTFDDLIDVPAPPPPPPVTDILIDDEETELTLSPLQDPKKKKRYQSSMLITSGVFNSANLSSGTSKKEQTDIYSAANDNDPNVGFADSYYNQDSVPNAYARKLGNTARLITQGKIVEAILETPINTDVPGMIRGIVSHDVYGESARIVLIPKGSRVVGTYNNLVIRGNKRVNIIWSRVIRPDGIDIMIRSPGTDQLGTAGVEGIVDNKYLEVFSSAFLVSAINIAVAVGADSLDNSEASETTNTDGSTTRSSTATNTAAVQAVDLFGSAAQNLIDGALNINPTITISQGTRVNIFVNRDLIFPGELLNQVQIIQ